ncbi:MAG: PAS domain S-box protein [Phenylobacterium sp.]|uniref:PAS domain-containing hybrid sensor histidine kinase/response regulator n=1 Tax=Phenylobacterium sp. TaxID=1871053 RepID=UPI00271D5CD5|nr:PAS domain S-box protein [Phenylobacterium sp.]MDO8911090.1 PAS domain S-box protein [Phenylobacterium sp.]MDP3099647.1 PAS domain S-box protein [Phenylobacterium sp.]
MPAERADNTPTEHGLMIQWLFTNSQELLLVIGPDARFKLVNPAWTATTGWASDEILGKSAADFIHPDDLEAFGEFAEQLIETRTGQNVARMRMKDGSYRWFEGRSQLTDDGQIIGTLRDATQDRERQAEVEDARRTRLLLSESAGVGTWSFEPAGERLDWSDDILAITGYSRDEMGSAEAFREILHPDEAQAVRSAFNRGILEGIPQTLEHRMRNKDGRWSTWRATFHCEPRRGGAFALKGMSQDITEMIAARDAAVAAERQIRQLIENAPFAVAMFDRDLRYLMISSRWRHAFSLGHRDHVGLRLEDVFPTIPKKFLAAQRRALKGEVISSKEDRFTDSQGGKHWVRWEARPWLDAAGEIGGMLAYVDDISAVASARREAQTNARRLKVALSAADAGVYEIDHVNKTFWASPEFKKLIGRSSRSYGDALKLNFPKFHADDMAGVRQAFLDINADRRKSGEAFEARIMTPSGEARWMRVFHHLKRDSKGRWLKGVGLVHDFDQRKRQELALIEAQQAAQAGAEAKAAFLANMSHEIRTPMNGVMGVLHLLKTESLSQDGRAMLEEALSCGQMLAELLNDVIDFSKIEAGALTLAEESVDPAALIQGVTRLLRPQAEAKGLELKLEGLADLDWVRTDPVRLRQALFNLVGNAVKFTLEGSITIRAALHNTSAGRVLRLEVADTGVGIPADAQGRIFQRFDQGDASTTRKFGGSGLGLAITQKLAEMMGGAVGFTSVEDKGSVFWLEVSAPRAEPVVAIADTGEPVLEGLRILVVEDNSTNRIIATKLLENLGASVETAADGLLGVKAAARGGFDLILMDVQMPGIDGLEACRRIRALGGPVAQTPIVALTANVLSHQHQSYLEAGMDGVVGKPISPTALLTEIARLSAPADFAEEAVA